MFSFSRLSFVRVSALLLLGGAAIVATKGLHEDEQNIKGNASLPRRLTPKSSKSSASGAPSDSPTQALVEPSSCEHSELAGTGGVNFLTQDIDCGDGRSIYDQEFRCNGNSITVGGNLFYRINLVGCNVICSPGNIGFTINGGGVSDSTFQSCESIWLDGGFPLTNVEFQNSTVSFGSGKIFALENVQFDADCVVESNTLWKVSGVVDTQ